MIYVAEKNSSVEAAMQPIGDASKGMYLYVPVPPISSSSQSNAEANDHTWHKLPIVPEIFERNGSANTQ